MNLVQNCVLILDTITIQLKLITGEKVIEDDYVAKSINVEVDYNSTNTM